MTCVRLSPLVLKGISKVARMKCVITLQNQSAPSQMTIQRLYIMCNCSAWSFSEQTSLVIKGYVFSVLIYSMVQVSASSVSAGEYYATYSKSPSPCCPRVYNKMYTYTCTYICTHTHTDIHTSIHTQRYTDRVAQWYKHTDTYIYIHVQYIYIYTYIYI